MATRKRVSPARNGRSSMAMRSVLQLLRPRSSPRSLGTAPWRNSPCFTPATVWRIIRATEPRNTRVPLPFTDLVQFIAGRFDRSATAPAPELATTAETGAYGERVAAAFLRRRGYRVLYRNYRVTGGEIDLVCRCKNVLVFVEVRTRA